MYRSGGAPSSKASASTRCQKCLQYGHYSYECKVAVKDRPYASRPSRTQQLFNPKLQTKLSEDNPNPLLQREGIADALLTKGEAERARQRSASVASSSSSESVATISTNASRSPSPRPKRRRTSREPERRRRSDGGNDDHVRRGRVRHEYAEERKSRHGTGHDRHRGPGDHRKPRRTPSRSLSRSPPPKRRVNAALRSPSPGKRLDHLDSRNRSRTRSPPRKYSDRSRSRSPGGGKDAYRYKRRSRSPPPSGHRKGYDHDRNRQSRDDHQDTLRGSYRHDDGGTVTYGKPPRERSLGPFSKRAALTAAMGRGR